MRARPFSISVGVGAVALFSINTLACGSGIDSPEETAKPPPTPSPAFSAPTNSAPTQQPTPSPTQQVSETPPTPVMAMPPAPADQPWQAPASIDPNSPVGRHGQLHVQGTALVDEQGAPVQLKGISSMWLNWEDRYSTSK